MKKYLLALLCLLLTSSALTAQSSNVIVYTENGDRFWAVVNGMRKNLDASSYLGISNIQASQSEATPVTLKFTFEREELGEMTATVYVDAGTENTYVLRPNTGRNNPNLIVNQPIVAATNAVTLRSVAVQDLTGSGGMNVSAKPSGNFGGGISITIDPQLGMGNGDVSQTPPAQPREPDTVYVPVEEEQYDYVEYVPGYTGPVGCSVPMNDDQFDEAASSVDNQTFASSKLKVAKQVGRNNCMTVSQVREMLELFTFEKDRLELAKYLYDYTYDLGNYYKLNDVFTFSSTVDKFDEFLQTK